MSVTKPTERTRTRMSGPERRGQLLDVAKRLAVRRGFHEISIEVVAREAGITRPVVYGHFEDLGGLLDALVEREVDRALGQLDVALPAGLAGGDAVERLLISFDTYLSAAESDPDTWRLVLVPPEGAPPALRQRIEAGREAIVAILSDAVAPAMGAGGDAIPDPELLGWTISSLADDAVRLLLSDPGRFPKERAIAQARWILERLFGVP